MVHVLQSSLDRPYNWPDALWLWLYGCLHAGPNLYGRFVSTIRCFRYGSYDLRSYAFRGSTAACGTKYVSQSGTGVGKQSLRIRGCGDDPCPGTDIQIWHTAAKEVSADTVITHGKQRIGPESKERLVMIGRLYMAGISLGGVLI
jgi:hypothetical protein